jgi:hypothetical protein
MNRRNIRRTNGSCAGLAGRADHRNEPRAMGRPWAWGISGTSILCGGLVGLVSLFYVTGCCITPQACSDTEDPAPASSPSPSPDRSPVAPTGDAEPGVLPSPAAAPDPEPEDFCGRGGFRRGLR